MSKRSRQQTAARVGDADWDEWEDVEIDDEWGRVYDDGVDAYVNVPRESSRGRRVLWVLGGIILFFVLVVGTFTVWVNRQIDPPGPPGGRVTIEVAEGATVTELAGDLEEAGIIGNGLIFRFYARQHGFEDVQAGTYDSLQENSSMGDVIDILELGPAAPPPAAQITFPEGVRLAGANPEVEAIITANLSEFDAEELSTALGAIRSRFQPPEAASLEGFLFPETYRIEDGDEDEEQKLVQQMVDQFDDVATTLGLDDAQARVGYTPYEVVIIASIIEREAGVPEDQPKVARVIYNRLAMGMPLEIDATLLYDIGHTETLTESELATDTPYNTRLYPGLPPTPIAMPGQSAIEAALNPETGPWLYYVLIEDDRHFFTDDYDEFLRVAQESRDAGIFE